MTSGVTRRVSCARVAVPALGRDGMLVVLAGAAGVMDAVAYLGLGVFTTMMTGNTALLAFAIARGELGPILRAGLALAAFGTGAAIGALITGRSSSRGEWRSVVTGALACEGPQLLEQGALAGLDRAHRTRSTLARWVLLSPPGC